ncbi:MAG: methionine aminotransferase [Ferruginibacter sp.]
MSLSIESKLPNAGTTIFTIMSALAVEHKAINLGQGFPDFMMNTELIGLVNEAMQLGFNQYVHMNGYPLLRERLAEKVNRLYNAPINAESDITITPGGTYAIYTALTAVLNPGDEVIVFEPAYDSYIPNIEINGAKAIPIPLCFPDYHIDWETVKAKITPRTKMIILNSPHNPTGAILKEADMEALQTIVSGTGIFILSDEVYEHLIFDGFRHESMLRYPQLRERSFVCFSFGKTYHCTGWKLGYCIAPPALMKEFRKVHQFNCFTCNSPMQIGLANFLERENEYLQLGAEVQLLRDYFEKGMQQTRFKALPTHGSYFQLFSYAAISDEKERDFAIRLTKEHGVATIPVSAFYQQEEEHQVVRFCFVKKQATIDAAIERLIKC